MELRFDHQFAAAPEQVYAQISDLPAAAKFAQYRGINLTVLGPRGPWALCFDWADRRIKSVRNWAKISQTNHWDLVSPPR